MVIASVSSEVFSPELRPIDPHRMPSMKRVYILRLIIWIVLSVVCLPDTWALACSTDFVARYGGEEFVFLAPGTELAGALQRAEKTDRRHGYSEPCP